MRDDRVGKQTRVEQFGGPAASIVDPDPCFSNGSLFDGYAVGCPRVTVERTGNGDDSIVAGSFGDE